MSTTVSPETKLLRTLNKIQYCSSNVYSLKRELQQIMNNFVKNVFYEVGHQLRIFFGVSPRRDYLPLVGECIFTLL
ncbi:hypothetical protein ACGRWE_00925 [Candidatus Phytoplasma australasiaticum]